VTSWNEGAGKPRRVTVAIDVDTSAFRAALDELRRSVGTVGEAFAGMAPAFREVASALTALAREVAMVGLGTLAQAPPKEQR